jgi:hypothetical protein
MAKTSSLPQVIFPLQVCSVQTAALFTSFEAQKIDRFIETPVPTMALHSGHLIKRRDILFHLSSFLLYNSQLYQSENSFLAMLSWKPRADVKAKTLFSCLFSILRLF